MSSPEQLGDDFSIPWQYRYTEQDPLAMNPGVEAIVKGHDGELKRLSHEEYVRAMGMTAFVTEPKPYFPPTDQPTSGFVPHKPHKGPDIFSSADIPEGPIIEALAELADSNGESMTAEFKNWIANQQTDIEEGGHNG